MIEEREYKNAKKELSKAIARGKRLKKKEFLEEVEGDVRGQAYTLLVKRFGAGH